MPSTPLKIVFAGTPEFAARHLSALIASEHHICAVYSQPDRPAGRGKKLKPSAVKSLALEHGLPVEQPVSLKDPQAQAQLAAWQCDIMIVVAYGLLLPQAVLDIPARGCINVHGSVLPKWRGAAPIQRAIEAGDQESGVTIMQMDRGLDTGDMLLIETCPIYDQDNTTDLHDRLCDIGPAALLKTLEQIACRTATPVAQDDSLSTYAKKIEKAEADIDWHLSATEIHRKIRAFNPFPICYTNYRGERLRIHDATIISESAVDATPGQVLPSDDAIIVQCGTGQLALTTLQLPGKKAMSSQAFVNGYGPLVDETQQPARLTCSKAQ